MSTNFFKSLMPFPFPLHSFYLFCVLITTYKITQMFFHEYRLASSSASTNRIFCVFVMRFGHHPLRSRDLVLSHCSDGILKAQDTAPACRKKCILLLFWNRSHKTAPFCCTWNTKWTQKHVIARASQEKRPKLRI